MAIPLTLFSLSSPAAAAAGHGYSSVSISHPIPIPSQQHQFTLRRRRRRRLVVQQRCFPIAAAASKPQQPNQHQEQEEEEEQQEAHVNDAGVKVALSLLHFYKREISPLLPRSCRYIPTCSEYSMQAFKKYGLAKGSILTACRICRCNPLGGYGFDPPRWFGEEREEPSSDL